MIPFTPALRVSRNILIPPNASAHFKIARNRPPNHRYQLPVADAACPGAVEVYHVEVPCALGQPYPPIIAAGSLLYTVTRSKSPFASLTQHPPIRSMANNIFMVFPLTAQLPGHPGFRLTLCCPAQPSDLEQRNPALSRHPRGLAPRR